MKYITIILISLFLNVAYTQNIHIPDTNLKSVLLADDKINLDMNDEISLEEANAFTGTIYCDSLNISDATGIEAFTNLAGLDIRMNEIATINLSKNINLRSLLCSQNNLTSLDISQSSNLNHLICDHNMLTELDLSNNKMIERFSINSNLLNTLDISACPLLTYLAFNNNSLNTIDLSNNPALTNIHGNRNNLQTIVLQTHSNLARIDLASNQISSINLHGSPALVELNININSVSELDLSQQQMIKRLYVEDNLLAAIDLSQNTELQRLRLSGNKLDKIDLSQNLELEILSLSNNILTSLDFSAHNKITELNVYACGLNYLNLRNGTNDQIVNLYCSKNENLHCILVDDNIAGTNPSNWNKDFNAFFNSDCSGDKSITIDSIQTSKACTAATHDGSVTILASGGFPPYFYQVHSYISEFNKIADLRHGRYQVIVFDTKGNYSLDTIDLNKQFNPKIKFNTINSSVGLFSSGHYSFNVCPEQFPLSIELIGDNRDDYNFSWSSESVGPSDTIFNPAYKTLEVEFSNDEGRSCDLELRVQKKDTCRGVLAIAKNISTPACSPLESNGSLQLDAVGVPPFTYALNDSINSTGYFENLASGNYLVTLTDGEGNSNEESVTLDHLYELNFSDTLVTIVNDDSLLEKSYEILKCPNADSTIITLLTPEEFIGTILWNTGHLDKETIVIAPPTNTQYSMSIYNTETLRQCIMTVNLEYDDEENCKPSATKNFPFETTKMNCYPNPTAGLLHINFEETGTKKIKILSYYGQVLAELETKTKNVHYNLEQFPSGIYFINAHSFNRIMSKMVLLNTY